MPAGILTSSVLLRLMRPAPLQGQHTDDILREHGFTDEAIKSLRDQHVVA